MKHTLFPGLCATWEHSHRCRPNPSFLLPVSSTPFNFTSTQMLVELCLTPLFSYELVMAGEWSRAFVVSAVGPEGLCWWRASPWTLLLGQTALPGPQCLGEAGRILPWKLWWGISSENFSSEKWQGLESQENKINKRKITVLNTLKRIKMGWCGGDNLFDTWDRIPESLFFLYLIFILKCKALLN